MKGYDDESLPPPGSEIDDAISEPRPERPSVTDAFGNTIRPLRDGLQPDQRGAPSPSAHRFGERIPSLLFVCIRWSSGPAGAGRLLPRRHLEQLGALRLGRREGGDRARPLPASLLAGVVFLSSLGTVIRSRMRGVLVHHGRKSKVARHHYSPRRYPAGETRGRWHGPRVVKRPGRSGAGVSGWSPEDDEGTMLELWDGTYA